MRGATIPLIAFALAALPGRSAGADETFAEANRAYGEAAYTEAIAKYESLVAAGVRHEDLYYNLGNAYFRAAATQDDKLGPAIYNFERALRLDPSFADARHNLGVARSAVAAKVVDRLQGAEGDPLWVRIATRYSVGGLTIAVLVLNGVFFASLLVLRFLNSGLARSALAVATVFAGVCELVIAALLGLHIYFLEEVRLGIVLPDESHLREGPNINRREEEQVHAGLRVHVVDEEAGWVRVRLANESEGWLPKDSIGEL